MAEPTGTNIVESLLVAGTALYIFEDSRKHAGGGIEAIVDRSSPGRFILTTIGRNAIPLVRFDAPYCFRLSSKGTVKVFRTEIDKLCIESRSMRLSWPSEIETSLARTNERITLGTACEITLGYDRVVFGTVGDLSYGGCRIIMDEFPEDVDAFKASIVISNSVTLEKVRCDIRWRREVKGKTVLGCEFRSMSEAHSEEVHRCLSSRASHPAVTS